MMHTIQKHEPSASAWMGQPGGYRRAGSRAARLGSPYWVLVEPDPPLTLFTLEFRNEAFALPVFSSHEEALHFASKAQGYRDGLRVRQTGGGELISLLSAPLRGVRHCADS